MLRSIFTNKETYIKKRTFTYFIPAPPTRKSGYQEKEFDFITEYLLESGFDIIDLKTQSISSEHCNGLWIICLLGAKTQMASEMKFDFEYQDLAGQREVEMEIELDPAIIHD